MGEKSAEFWESSLPPDAQKFWESILPPTPKNSPNSLRATILGRGSRKTSAETILAEMDGTEGVAVKRPMTAQDFAKRKRKAQAKIEKGYFELFSSRLKRLKSKKMEKVKKAKKSQNKANYHKVLLYLNKLGKKKRFKLINKIKSQAAVEMKSAVTAKPQSKLSKERRRSCQQRTTSY